MALLNRQLDAKAPDLHRPGAFQLSKRLLKVEIWDIYSEIMVKEFRRLKRAGEGYIPDVYQ
ncbi:hypothetical protein EEL35_04195 [Muribaculaceae bacterium Isolate-042 (Harlan)]|jgi:hypothetical protein|uniref:Uncharacterized protein n=1 Tax=Muribaculum intestinale TaxID=1796646 RepID=A0A1B1SC18_9BACT|nr:hypothetical protein A4V02_11765 [Muribaculum intestinale]ROS81571.1 hypothetical protein EEL35_04195 [Muribaculaceae bacterium Isolate-042 (Harlan)]ROT11142.1 hypothetical protein EEL42_00040 [Muribaculaceae bacterium Isolate-100 (HZI)]ASB37580.1 hypothetical protein ADH68_05950 [Muribaculum intestinale]PWB05290.1 hypothetical protein C5O29_01815 [Muribaculum intestinale]